MSYSTTKYFSIHSDNCIQIDIDLQISGEMDDIVIFHNAPHVWKCLFKNKKNSK